MRPDKFGVHTQHLGKMVSRCEFFATTIDFTYSESKNLVDLDIWNLPCSSGKGRMVMTRYPCLLICQVYIVNTLLDDKARTNYGYKN